MFAIPFAGIGASNHTLITVLIVLAIIVALIFIFGYLFRGSWYHRGPR